MSVVYGYGKFEHFDNLICDFKQTIIQNEYIHDTYALTEIEDTSHRDNTHIHKQSISISRSVDKTMRW